MVDGIKPIAPARMPEISPKPAADDGAIKAIDPLQPTAETGEQPPRDPKEMLDLLTTRDRIAKEGRLPRDKGDDGKPKPQNSR